MVHGPGNGLAGGGAGVVAVVEATATLSNVDVFDVERSWLDTMRPRVAVVAIDSGVLPRVVHVEPLDDT